MPFRNVSTITEFIIAGFPALEPAHYGFVGLLFFFTYITIVAGNTFILILVAMERRLQKPTYLIFCNMALADLILSNATLPKIIAVYWAEDRTISFHSCFVQMVFVHFYGAFYALTLLIMTLDRYIAICNPLRYNAIITNSTVTALSVLLGSIATVRVVTLAVTSVTLPYCQSNKIFQCFCDHTSITNLACANVREVQLVAFGFAMALQIAPISFILFTYVSIFITVMNIASAERRRKVFSTFSSQIIIVCLYYIPRSFSYISNIVSYKLSIDSRIAIIMLYTLIPPMVNPLIYCLWTTEIKEAVKRKLKFKKVESIVSK